MWARLKLKVGDASFSPNIGLAQGSLLSPALFDIYFEPILRKLVQAGISVENILAYADDLLVICDDIPQTRSIIKLLKMELEKVGLKLNK